MSSANIGWLFYKDYFRDGPGGINYHDRADTHNETVVQNKTKNIIRQKPQIVEENILGNIHFKATTTYPGLLLGSGNAHELPSVEGQAVLGFHFDYTTGLPVIQGSSIKGVLRSAFKHPEYIKELLNKEDIDISELEKEIFDNGDIFFDAVIFNPPYHVEGQSSHDPDRRRVREASLELLEGFVRAANYLVKNKGRVFTAVKPQIFMHLVHFMQRFRLEPKRLRFAHGKLDKRAFLVLIESMKNGGREILVEPPYIVEL